MIKQSYNLIKWGSEFSSYDTELGKMTSQIELLTQTFSQKFFLRVTNLNL